MIGAAVVGGLTAPGAMPRRAIGPVVIAASGPRIFGGAPPTRPPAPAGATAARRAHRRRARSSSRPPHTGGPPRARQGVPGAPRASRPGPMAPACRRGRLRLGAARPTAGGGPSCWRQCVENHPPHAHTRGRGAALVAPAARLAPPAPRGLRPASAPRRRGSAMLGQQPRHCRGAPPSGPGTRALQPAGRGGRGVACGRPPPAAPRRTPKRPGMWRGWPHRFS
jgi:hypothetical protein